MHDIATLLKSVAPDAVRPDAGLVDADLARGRAALATARRRRISRRLATGATATAATAACAVIVTMASTSTPATQPKLGYVHITKSGLPRTPTGTRSKTAGGTRIQLVDYTGTQLPGFTVAQIPEGWHLSTSTPTALLITPNGSTDNDPNVFANKLAVLPQSVDESGLGPGVPVTVNGRPGRLDTHAGGDVLVLRYTTPQGHAVDIQAPLALHWSTAQLITFAEGVIVTANVGVTHG